MTFYQELQLSSAGSKQLIKSTKDKKEKFRHILIYNFKVYLVMIFCVAVVTLFTKFSVGQRTDAATDGGRVAAVSGAHTIPDSRAGRPWA